MADGKKECPTSPQAAVTANALLFGLLSSLLQQIKVERERQTLYYAQEQEVKVESLTNQEEVELRSKIQALGLEVTKVPSKSAQNLDEMEIAKQLDKLSEKLDNVDRMISSAVAADPHVGSLLRSTADLWSYYGWF